MQLSPASLSRHLRDGLAPVYLLAGQVPLLIEEAADAVRAAVRQAGGEERVVLTAEPGFDWPQLIREMQGQSLFAARRLIELRLPTARPGDAGAKALREAAAAASVDEATTLLVICHGEPAMRRTQWYRALEQAGAAMYAWPLSTAEHERWLQRRLAAQRLRPTSDALALLVQRTEGNLLAAAQEVEKLRLLAAGDAVDEALVMRAVASGSRYDVFDLAEAVLAGEPARVVRILRALQTEDVALPLVLWALARDLRLLVQLSAGGAPADESRLQRLGVRPNRRPALRSAVRRHPHGGWLILLGRMARLDARAKGGPSPPGAPPLAHELLDLALSMTLPRRGRATDTQ